MFTLVIGWNREGITVDMDYWLTGIKGRHFLAHNAGYKFYLKGKDSRVLAIPSPVSTKMSSRALDLIHTTAHLYMFWANFSLYIAPVMGTSDGHQVEKKYLLCMV